MKRLEVKVNGAGHRAAHEIVWLDVDDYDVVDTGGHYRAKLLLMTKDKKLAFSIMTGVRREKFLIKNGYDPDAPDEGVGT